MYKRLRIGILLFILLTVAISAWRANAKVTGWKSTLQVALFPINADGSTASQRYIEALQPESIEPISKYLGEQASAHGLQMLYPVRVSLGPVIRTLPPPQPRGGSALDAIRWSLSMRWWAWRHTPATAIHPDVRLYLLYYDPATHTSVPDSAGLAKGQIGIAHLFATRTMHGSNLVVSTHELLHTLGATDKYEPRNGLPRFPEGYAEPARTPRLPQLQAEIMAGRIPRDEEHAEIPVSLDETLIGPVTAREIGWARQ
ncbi:hypothetical protein Q9Q94_13405 [Uliginosibacterium sp. 31-16]|uniref:hypothetical protein n=1 Tax=Uliginosibacterium sp. 31-16 TaxID=3068315 RepID=UPI00273D2F66|nr:hypothetical protein [Uliginosibacterium sp. 31-16]MDP5240535.1 hypothetical protein [Uliginosibacterium sp. 31-16]